jgi:hypothetical protein
MRLDRKFVLLALTGCVSACASTITGSVTGSFTNGQPLLTFTNGSGINLNLGDNVGDSVALTGAQLGSFVINRTCSTNGCTESLPSSTPFTSFGLTFNFSVPSPTGGNPINYTITSQPSATLLASLTRSGNSSNFTSSITANFDNTQQVITYSGGSFGLVLNATSFSSGSVSSAQTVQLTGTLTRLSSAASGVPEPATFGFVGLVFTAGAILNRRRVRASR